MRGCAVLLCALLVYAGCAGAPPWPRYRPDDPARLVFTGVIGPSRAYGEDCAFRDSVGYGEKGLFERMRRSFSPAVPR